MSSLPTHRKRPTALVALGTALVLVTYVTPMASVPQTVVDLGSGSGARAWILSSMSVGLAAGLLASGALGDAWGRRRVYLAGIALLAAGSLGSAVAPSSAVFVGARVVEGLGGAAVLACGLAILAHAFTEPAARAHATGIWGASVGLGITVGALLAAVLDFGTGWRETYAVVGAVALGLLWPSMRWLPESKAEQPRRLDLLGVLTLAAALTLVVSGLTQARSGISTGTCVLLGLSALLLVAFVLVERHTAEPMLDLELLRSPGFLAATVGALVLGIGIIGMTSNVPFLVQVGLGDSLWVATWLVAGWSVTSVLASLLLRRFKVPLSGPNLIAVAMLVVGVGQLLALGIGTGSSPWRLLPSHAGRRVGDRRAQRRARSRGGRQRPGRPRGDGERIEQHRPLPRSGVRDHGVLGGPQPRGQRCGCRQAGRRMVVRGPPRERGLDRGCLGHRGGWCHRQDG